MQAGSSASWALAIFRMCPADENLTQARRAEVRRELMASLDEWDTLDFMPDRNRARNCFVFTDVDCGYCRRLHQQMAEYHELGIGVRYVAFPRSGPDTDSWARCSRSGAPTIARRP